MPSITLPSSAQHQHSVEEGFVSGSSAEETSPSYVDRLAYNLSTGMTLGDGDLKGFSFGHKKCSSDSGASSGDGHLDQNGFDSAIDGSVPFLSTLRSDNSSSNNSLGGTNNNNHHHHDQRSTTGMVQGISILPRHMGTIGDVIGSQQPQPRRTTPGSWYFEDSPDNVFGGGSQSPPLSAADSYENHPSYLKADGLLLNSRNTTDSVIVPSSEHVAEIVGRQGCKIKALRAKTNTYIKTPVRGEDPVFAITGRPEDVAKAKEEIELAAEHFTQIRASRRHSQGGAPAPGHITAYVRVPLRVVGLVVGPKGATIKRIQQDTHTYIITPSREREPIFEVTGLPANVEAARREIEQHIFQRTGNRPITDPSASISTLASAYDHVNQTTQQQPQQHRQIAPALAYGALAAQSAAVRRGSALDAVTAATYIDRYLMDEALQNGSRTAVDATAYTNGVPLIRSTKGGLTAAYQQQHHQLSPNAVAYNTALLQQQMQQLELTARNGQCYTNGGQGPYQQWSMGGLSNDHQLNNLQQQQQQQQHLLQQQQQMYGNGAAITNGAGDNDYYTQLRQPMMNGGGLASRDEGLGESPATAISWGGSYANNNNNNNNMISTTCGTNSDSNLTSQLNSSGCSADSAWTLPMNRLMIASIWSDVNDPQNQPSQRPEKTAELA